jgi:hypothetical protein
MKGGRLAVPQSAKFDENAFETGSPRMKSDLENLHGDDVLDLSTCRSRPLP